MFCAVKGYDMCAHYTDLFLCVMCLCVVCCQEAQAYADENSLLFMETSAKTAMNVNDIFLAIGMSEKSAFSILGPCHDATKPSYSINVF